MKILIVEDDRTLNDGIALSLGKENVRQAYGIKQAGELLGEDTDLVILDINLPDGNGMDLCREIRSKSSVPIIFLTANDMEIDIVSGLESGADDYITKPFSLAVLRARVNAVLRRRKEEKEGKEAKTEKEESKVFKTGDFLFDFDKMHFFAGGRQVELSKTEQKLLKALTENAGRTLSREMLIDRIWDSSDFIEENALSVTMNRLRQKLPGIPVKTIYGIGYIWEKQ